MLHELVVFSQYVTRGDIFHVSQVNICSDMLMPDSSLCAHPCRRSNMHVNDPIFHVSV